VDLLDPYSGSGWTRRSLAGEAAAAAATSEDWDDPVLTDLA